ncbi:NepR family anti-sigma factor [Woodsholea maritima]|uniref:NepR family anti-sigma factor n=1 Tax=Woodsholea maritima TaxID=240237 RepID=UPI00036A09A4|nr:NepR family anti-sigma factor [Woodsholea maritima]
MPRSKQQLDSRTEVEGQDPSQVKQRQEVIGRRIRDFYNDVVEEGVPDAFSQLLDQLDQAQKRNNG